MSIAGNILRIHVTGPIHYPRRKIHFYLLRDGETPEGPGTIRPNTAASYRREILAAPGIAHRPPTSIQLSGIEEILTTLRGTECY